MTPAAELLQPESNPALYVSSVLTLYVDLPDTPLRASASDQPTFGSLPVRVRAEISHNEQDGERRKSGVCSPGG